MASSVRLTSDAELRRLTALRELQLLDAAENERFERVVDAAQQEFGVPIACIMLVDDDRQWMAARRGPLPQETSTDGSICKTAMWSPETFVVPDATLEPRFATSQYVTGDPHLRFYASQPLYAPSGEPIGTLCVMDTRARRLEDAEVRSLAELGRWAQNEIFASVAPDPTPEVLARLRATPVEQYAVLSLPAPPAERTGARFYDWSPVPHGLLLGVGGVEAADGRPALASAVVLSTLRNARLDLEPGVALEVAAYEITRELAATEATAEVFLARLDTVDGRLDHVSVGRSLAVVVHTDGSYERLDGSPATDAADPAVAPRTLVDRARVLLTGGRTASDPRSQPLSPSGTPVGHPAGAVARRTRLRAQDTLICLTQEWSDIDEETLRALAQAASAATLRELRTTLQDLQRDHAWTGGCGLLLRHEDPSA